MARNKNKKPTANNRSSGVTIIKNVAVNADGVPISKHKASRSNKPNKSENTTVDMRLAKIRNRYMFNSNKPTQEHIYAVYTDYTTKEVRAIEATHLYIPDEENMNKVKRGLLRKVRFNGYETPSAVYNSYYDTNIEGKPIDLLHADVRVDKTPIPQKQAKAIKDFAKSKRKR